MFINLSMYLFCYYIKFYLSIVVDWIKNLAVIPIKNEIKNYNIPSIALQALSTPKEQALVKKITALTSLCCL